MVVVAIGHRRASRCSTLTFVGSKVWATILSCAGRGRRAAGRCAGRAVRFLFSISRARTGSSACPIPKRSTRETEITSGSIRSNDTAARDDIVSAISVVPVDRAIALTMHSKDVGHSFFVPELRMQQDFVPGLVIPLHFTATQVGKTRDRVHAALRPRALQHEGVSGSDERRRVREVAADRRAVLSRSLDCRIGNAQLAVYESSCPWTLCRRH